MAALPPSSDVAFTAAVKAVQERRGSRRAYRRLEEKGGWRTTATPELAQFIATRDSVYFATANAAGQPYIQHRGGPKGFIHVLDEKTLGFADYSGNRQYITIGNLSENRHAFLFLTDYAHRRRIKIWGHARVVDDDPALIERLMPRDYRATPEQAILFTIEAWDVNCPQHIPQKFDTAEVEAAAAPLHARIAALEAEVTRLSALLGIRA
ncbi:MAG TPA: pyridoxamine 5'-phosphate oxidase family protein [Stellaceae bacterium]|nr:pyridoxamine 5'-phosphate oxidase family protein [Stellaceae bacterium]